MPIQKVVRDAREAILKAGIKEGSTIMMGGFGLCGIPENLILALRDLDYQNLTVISNNAGVDDFGLGLLLQTRQVKKMVSTYVGENAIFERQFLDGVLELEFVPQGTFSERIRAGGAGIGGFFTPTGAGTIIAEGKESRIIEGKEYILEKPLQAEFAFVKAYQGDKLGNLIYRMSARNFNPMMATAAKITIAEVEHLVEPGELEPDCIHTPGIYVKYIFQGKNYEKRIEQRTNRPQGS